MSQIELLLCIEIEYQITIFTFGDTEQFQSSEVNF